MNTLAEIQEAVTRLPGDQREVLSIWLNSQMETPMTNAEEEMLVRSLNEAIRDLDAGKGVPIEEVRKNVDAWAAE